MPISIIVSIVSYVGSGVEVIAIIVAAIAIIFAILLLGLPFIFTPYIVIENKEDSIGKMITESFKMVFSNLGKIIVMYLSLIPWYLLVIITFGIGTFYVTPYVNTIFYVMYKDIRGEELLEFKKLY